MEVPLDRLPEQANAQDKNHGTKSTYVMGCRCAECRAANTERNNVNRWLRSARVHELPPEKHGLYSTYTNWMCRCEACATTGAEMQRVHRAKRAARAGRAT